MLVLTRKVGDVIVIGDNIEVVVLDIKGKQVRLGVKADKSVVVHREEIYRKIKQETSDAACTEATDTYAAVSVLLQMGMEETFPRSRPNERQAIKILKNR